MTCPRGQGYAGWKCTAMQTMPRRDRTSCVQRHTPKNISAATVARTAVLGLALTNQLLSAAGKPVLPIESTQVEQLVSAGFTIGAALASWWYNNSFTQAAIKADEEFERQKKRV